MADLSGAPIDATVEETSSRTLIPAGKYRVVIANDVLKDNKKGNGKILEITFQVIDGDYATETIKDYLNITNPSEVAQKIGQGTLKKLCRLTKNNFPPTDTSLMWGISLIAKIDIEVGQYQGRETQNNKITGYYDMDTPITQTTPPPETAPAPATPSSQW